MNATSDYRTVTTADLPVYRGCVAWSAIFSGAIAAAAISIILVFLGSGIGLSFSSPYTQGAPSIMGFTVKTAVWLIVMQWIAAAVGGFMAGHLRHKAAGIHRDDVLFRDTAHGFLAWAVATIFTVGFLASGVAAAVTAGAHAAPGPRGGAAENGPVAYYTDNLFRTASKPRPISPDARGEASRILLTDATVQPFPQDDKTYLANLIAANTGLSTDEASARVDNAISRMQADTDKARKSAATFAFFTFLSMLIGAFIAATAAALGGIHRDEAY